MSQLEVTSGQFQDGTEYFVASHCMSHAQAQRCIVFLFVLICISDSLGCYSCYKFDALYDDTAFSLNWYHDREVLKWYCQACYREACRDAQKELQAVTNGEYCSAVQHAEARRQYIKEFTKVIRNTSKKTEVIRSEISNDIEMQDV